MVIEKRQLYVLLVVVVLSCTLVRDANADSVPKALIDTPGKTIDFSQFLGIGAQLEWFNATVVQKQIDYLKAINVSWIRVDVHFDQLVPSQGNYQWGKIDATLQVAKNNNMNVIVFVAGTARWLSTYYDNNTYNLTFTDTWPPSNSTLYGEILVTMNARYPFVKYWELWNEMNLVPAFWAPTYNPTAYYSLFAEVKRVFTLYNIQDKLIPGSMGYYGNTDVQDQNMIYDLVSAGNPYKNSICSYHPYTEYPEGGPTQLPDSMYGNRNTTAYLNYVLKSQASVSQIWATEWGWSTHDVSELTQAQNTLKRLLMDTINGLDKTFLFTTSDLDARASSLRDQKYGIVDLNLQPKPVYTALKRLLITILSSSSIGPCKSELNFVGTDPNMVFISFTKLSTNTSMIAYWNANISAPTSTITVSGANISPSSKARVYQLTQDPNSDISSSSSSFFSLQVQHNIQIIEWPIKDDDSSASPTSSSSSSSSSSPPATSGSTTTTSSTSSTSTSTTTTTSSPTTSKSNDPDSPSNSSKNNTPILLLFFSFIGVLVFLI
ncbi:hypothetical protein CYY_009202 [Polysphondylium violaceum]|uniref:Glycoside hydrolase family 5 domain-containing protein n=1 Tax=Polysphondylium violaceum TaxID=133409 RepID=A0A8J4UW99_9MYCE|nr:hypothetical protein CYY_009202 [Polysphondylium violaceum]